MFKGSFPASLFFKLCTIIIIPTLFIIYEISQIYGHEPPFPNCWISKCAQHYPEFVFFRFATISGAILAAMGWFTNYFYLKTISRDHAFNIGKYHPEVVVVIGLMGTFLLMGNTATIDTGKMNEKWHETCASTFFIFTLTAQVLNAIMYSVVYANIKTVSYNNILFKYFLIVLLALQGLLSLFQGGVGGFWNLSEENRTSANSIDIFLEWSLTCTIIMGFYSMSIDVNHF